MTLPLPPSRPALIIQWLTAAGWDVRQELGYPLVPGPEILLEPDRIVHITETTGPGYVTEEGAADAWGFQARLRGPQDDSASASAAMGQLDALIMAAGQIPGNIGGIWISRVSRLGAPPAPLPFDPNDRRTEYTCNYIAVTSLPAYVGA